MKIFKRKLFKSDVEENKILKENTKSNMDNERSLKAIYNYLASSFASCPWSYYPMYPFCYPLFPPYEPFINEVQKDNKDEKDKESESEKK